MKKEGPGKPARGAFIEKTNCSEKIQDLTGMKAVPLIKFQKNIFL
jgi:hypothetical protein